TASGYDDGVHHDCLFVIDQTANTISLHVDDETLTDDLGGAGGISNNTDALRFLVASGVTGLAGTGISYAAYWQSALTAANLATIRTEIGSSGAGDGDGMTQAVAIPSYIYPNPSGSG